MTLSLLPLTAASYRPHPLHGTERVWEQTNCWIDAWVEVLHSLGLDPLAAAAFTVATDFEGDQWTFYKYPPADLWTAYGIDVHEMNPWRPLTDTVEDQLGRGRLLTLECDAWFLPDTAGVSYRLEHTKSTIVPNAIDTAARTLGYFHNSGYHELAGDDFDGVLRRGEHRALELAPYCEVVRLESVVVRPEEELTTLARERLQHHLALRPRDNPVTRMAADVETRIPWMQQSGPEAFHALAFATVRQCGANAETAASFCRWLAGRDPAHAEPLEESAGHWVALAEASKAVQLRLARVARGRQSALDEAWASMAGHWSRAQGALDRTQQP